MTWPGSWVELMLYGKVFGKDSHSGQVNESHYVTLLMSAINV